MINVVFLMLIFFLIAGTVAAPLDPDLKLVEVSGLDGREPPDALVLRQDGTLVFRRAATDVAQYMSTQESDAVRIVPDRNVSGQRLVDVSTSLRRLGATSVIIVTERALK